MFTDDDTTINAGQTVYYSATIPNSDNALSIGNSFTITTTGYIGSNLITESGVVTVTGF